MTILEVTVQWGGFQGAPGYTNLHFTNAGIITTAVDNAVNSVVDLFTDLQPVFATRQTFQVSNEVKEFDPATGELVGLHSPGTTPSVITGGTFNALGPGPAGMCVSLGTSGINRGRKVRGRVFLVPLVSQAFQDDGTINASTLTTAAEAFTAWRTSAAYETLVWSRPRAGAGGAAFPIVSSSIKDKAAVLRSRRD